MKWQIKLTVPALNQLVLIEDTRLREGISRRIKALENDPEKQGKPLADELAGYRNVRGIGQRYRILYKTEADQVVVVAIAVGNYKEDSKADVYTLVKKLARLGLLTSVE